MAGLGTRLRPQTLTTPKPLLPIAGKAMVYHIVDELASMLVEKIEEVCFVIGDFGSEAEGRLLNVASSINASGKIAHQHRPLGTADAILCAGNSLSGPLIVVFADTLFRGKFSIDPDADGIIWTCQVDNPESFGVVKTGPGDVITDFVEKPQKFVSNKAITGIYYFRSGEYLRKELQSLKDNNCMKNGEYQLTDALENMKSRGVIFMAKQIDEWLDCGTKETTINTNKRMLELCSREKNANKVQQKNSEIIEPCYFGKNISLLNSTVGPYVSLGDNTVISNSVIQASIIQENCHLENIGLANSLVGNFVQIKGSGSDTLNCEMNVGDYSIIKKL
ncbi:MAG: sugar phosphate nucleotidyltransferase [Flavobacteriales bacterium]